MISVSRDGAIISWKWWPACDVKDYEEEGKDLKNRGFNLTQLKRKQRKTESKEEEADNKSEQGEECSADTGVREKKRRKISTEDVVHKEDHLVGSGAGSLPSDTAIESQSASVSERMYIEGKWTLENKVFCNTGHHGRVVKCHFHVHQGLLVIGFTNGVISLYECPAFDALYTLSIGNESSLESICINHDGEWLAMGSAGSGQVSFED